MTDIKKISTLDPVTNANLGASSLIPIQDIESGVAQALAVSELDKRYSGSGLQTQITNHETRITTLENVVAAGLTQIPHHLAFTQEPANVVAGAAFVPPIIVEIQDIHNNPVIGDVSVVTLSISAGLGTVANASVTAVDGQAVFTNAMVGIVQTNAVLQADRVGLSPVVSSAFNVAAQAPVQSPDHLTFVVQPSNVIATRPIIPSVVVHVKDTNGQNVAGDTSEITLSIHTGSGALSHNVGVCSNGVAVFDQLSIDTQQNGVVLRATRTGGGATVADSSAFNVAAVPADEIRIPSEYFRPLPQPHEPWTPTYVTSAAFKMAPRQIRALWFRVKSNSAVTLALGGSDASKYIATFYKPYGQVTNNADAFQRASLMSSPLGIYFDPLNPIPSGASNFTPEVGNQYEYVVCKLECKSTTTTGNHSLSISFGGDSVALSVHAWNITMPVAPSIPLTILAGAGTADKGLYGGFTSSQNEAVMAGNITDLLVNFRCAPYLQGLAFLGISGSTLNIDNLNGYGGSFRQLVLDRMPANTPKCWALNPMTTSAHRQANIALAAQNTIVAEGLESKKMWLYVWDEPPASAAAQIKLTLDNWFANSPDTKLVLTTDLDYDQSAEAIAAGLDFSDYGDQLVLTPVINNIGGPSRPVTDYINDAFGWYPSCYGNCAGSALNTNGFSPGNDTGLVDYAYIDCPMVRKLAAYGLSCRSNWQPKIFHTLHYDSMQAWNQFNGVLTDPSKNPWLSARRFGIMGDGTLLYPPIPNFKPHTGIPAFASDSKTALPSYRLLWIAHASGMADLFSLYTTAHAGVHVSDQLVTDQRIFETRYSEYESLMTRVGDALEAGTAIGAGVATQVQFIVQPSGTNVNAAIAPAVQIAIADIFGAVVTGDNASTITVSKQSGAGTLSGTLTKTVVSGVATFPDLAFNASGSYVIHAVSASLTAANSSSFSVSAAAIDLNNIASMVHWFRTDSLVLSGANITRWTNKKTGGTYHLTSQNQTPPTLVTNILNGKPVANFDGTQISHGFLGVPIPTSVWIAVVFKVNNSMAAGGITGAWDRFADWSLRYTGSKLISLNIGDNGASDFTDGSTNVDTAWHWALLNYRQEGVPPLTHRVFLDGAGSAEIATTHGQQPFESLRLGGLLSNNTAGTGEGVSVLPGNIQVGEAIVFNNTFDINADYQTVKDYMNGYWGL